MEATEPASQWVSVTELTESMMALGSEVTASRGGATLQCNKPPLAYWIWPAGAEQPCGGLGQSKNMTEFAFGFQLLRYIMQQAGAGIKNLAV